MLSDKQEANSVSQTPDSFKVGNSAGQASLRHK